MKKNDEVKNEIKEYKPLVKHSKRRNELLSNKETSIIKKQNRKFIKWFVVSGIALMSIIIFTCIIDIYKYFSEINVYVGYISLGVLALLIIIFIIRPIVVALSTPCFTLDVIDDESKANINRINYQKLKKVAKNLCDGEDISQESKEKINEVLSSRKELNNCLRDVYDKEIQLKINKIINESATKVLISTAISQNNRFDAATVALVNVRMIMRIVIACGYHPTYPQLYKLIAKVFRNALIAYTIQSINVDELIFNGINKLVKGALSSIPVLGEVTKSVTQGAANALLTLRIGIITRKYLYEEFDIQAMIDDPINANEGILEDAVIEANSSIDDLLKEYKSTRNEKARI